EEHRARVVEERQAGRSRLHAASLAHEQLDAEVELELRDALADCRRLDVLQLGGARHRPALADGDEQAQRLDVEVVHPAIMPLRRQTRRFRTAAQAVAERLESE